jgi:hypothetical protein|nr:MAG TPA: DNA binding protein [Microviridae sp.]
MTYGLYSIKDAKTGFMTPTVDQNDLSALRNFEHAVNRSDSLLNSHPNDFTLCRLASFDTDSGVCDVLAVPFVVADASEVLRNER